MSGPDASRSFWRWWWLGFFLWLAGLAWAAGWDLEVARALVRPEATLGRAVERYGEVPAWLITIFCVVILTTPRRENPTFIALRPLAWAVVLVAVLCPLLLTQSLKFFWGRVRFRDLGLDLAAYTPFFIPAGIGVGESFPSGHVAMATTVCPIAFYISRSGRRIWTVLAWLIVLGYIIGVGLGRILAGAHFFCDCLFSIGAGLLIAAWISRRLLPRRDASAGLTAAVASE